MADSLLPPPLAADERFRALEQLAARLDELDLTRLLVYLIDTVSSSALPHLAEQFHVQGYEGWLFAKTEDDRRRLLKRAIELHRHKGTRWAVEQVLATLSLPGRIREWFEYGGEPFYFRVDVDVTRSGFGLTTFDALVALIDEYKNVRSHLERLTVSISNSGVTPIVAVAALVGEVTSIYPYQQDDMAQSGRLYASSVHLAIETTAIYPQTT